jgi:long-chain acyl-CoA synthetase
VPDPEFRQSVVAAVQTQDGISLTAQQVRDFLSNKLANFNVPRVVEFRDSLPREDTGKIWPCAEISTALQIVFKIEGVEYRTS